MATYRYVDTTGAVKTIEANDPNSAIASAPNRMSNSGVQLVRTPVAQTPTTPIAPTPAPNTPRYDMTSQEGLLGEAQRGAYEATQNPQDIQRQAEEYAARIRQAQIDAINTIYAPKYKLAEEEATQETARARALALRTGQLGSGEKAYQVGGAEKVNEAKRAEIDQQKMAQIQLAFGHYDEMKAKEAERLTKQATETAEGKVKYYQEQANKALESVKALGAGGVTLEELKQNEPQAYKDLKEIGGMSDFEIASQMAEANPALDAKIQYEDGVAYLAYVNPKTGKLEVQTQQVGKLSQGEEFKSIDGIGYAMSEDANGQLKLRPLTSKTTTPKSTTTSIKDKYTQAEDLIAGNPDMTDDQLKTLIRKETGLAITDVNSLIASRERQTVTPEVVKDKIVDVLSNQKSSYTRNEARVAAETQLKKSLGLRTNDELPQAYLNSVEDALVEVYGRTFMQKIVPFGR